MSGQVVVQKHRTTVITVGLGYDVSSDTLTSQIRTEPNQAATLLAEWDVAYTTDGTDGELTLTLDNTPAGQIEASVGYMDILRMSGSEPLSVFDTPLQVVFRGTVTADA